MDEHTAGNAEEQARHEREAALHALAGASPSPAATPTSSSTRPRPRRRVVAVVLLTALLIVAAGGVGWWRFSQHPSGAATGPLILRFPDGHIRCPQAVSWSPDGKQVLVYGDSTCPNQQSGRDVSPDPQFEVYDPRTWRLTRDIHLLPLEASIKPLVVSPDLRHDQATLKQVSLSVGGTIYWLADPSQIAIGLGVFTDNLVESGGSQAQFWDGWLLLNIQTQAVRAIIRPTSTAPVPPSPYSSYLPSQLTRWDFTTGTASQITISPGLGYRWDASGHLEATEPLPAWESTPAAPPLGPVGQPIGGSSFTIWQQAVVGMATMYIYNGCTPPYFPVTIELSARSPDGRYLVEGISLNARFAAPASAISTPPGGWGNPDQCPPLPTTPPTDGPSGAPNFLAPLPIRDAGLAAALRALAGEPSTKQLRLAWSPDGTRLAVQERAAADARRALHHL